MRLSYRNAMNQPMLSPQEEVEVIEAWQVRKDPKALDRICLSHARLAYSIASRFTQNPDHLEDLAQEGIVGLMKAADKFDPQAGTRFATYSRWWIMTFVSAAAAKVGTVIDMPSRTYLEAKIGKLKGPDKAAAQMAAFGAVALDAPIGEEGDLTAMDMLECPRPDPEEISSKTSNEKYYRQTVAKALDVLKPREREVMMRRRLNDRPETLEAIAQDLGVTRERVRQIEMMAVSKVHKAIVAEGFARTALR